MRCDMSTWNGMIIYIHFWPDIQRNADKVGDEEATTERKEDGRDDKRENMKCKDAHTS